MIRDAQRGILWLDPEPRGAKLAPLHVTLGQTYPGPWADGDTFWFYEGPGCNCHHPPGTPCPPVQTVPPGQGSGDKAWFTDSKLKGTRGGQATARQALEIGRAHV